MTNKRLRSLCDEAVPTNAGDRFSMPALKAALLGTSASRAALPKIHVTTSLPDQLQDKLAASIIRHALLIEPVVLPGATTTRYKTRWGISPDDPRYASVDSCLEIAERVVRLLQRLIKSDEGIIVLDSFSQYGMVPYELPIDYNNRRAPIHRADNIKLVDSAIVREVAGLRMLLLDRHNPHRNDFARIYHNKIQVKTYLTDRVLTGSHLTNREKRWEAHPDSVQFAHRTACLGIERVLINLLCHFDHFPDTLRRLLDEGALLRDGGTDPTRCPVTLEALSYPDFVASVTHPDHGRSRFQVGHLDPLKLEGNTWHDGHSPSNIGWLSDDGNRIQGSMSVTETREMLARIWQAYSEAGLLPIG